LHKYQNWKETVKEMEEDPTWKKAVGRFIKKGMSESEIAEQHKAWRKAHPKKKIPKPEMLGKGKAAGVAKTALSRKRTLEQLAAELEGKKF
jgi:hypothetical protein